MDELIPALMTGTRRRPEPLQHPLFAGLVGSPEEQRLSAAALAGISGRAGQRPEEGPPLAADSQVDDRPLAPGRSLHRILEGDYRHLLREWLELAHEGGCRPDPGHLPQLLEIGRGERSLRSLLSRVCGSRGAWLAGHNPDWAYLLGQTQEDESIWEQGQGALRMEWFARLRQRDSARARQLLAASWSSESADHRLKALQAMAAGLSMEDEDFLEAALDDRSKGVRAQAASLLSSLPASRLAQRARARLAEWVRESLTGLEVQLPAECTREMLRDGFEPKSAYRDLGEKAWWLQQAVAQTPLDFWRASPEVVLQLAAQGDWTRPLQQGWVEAAQTQANVRWADALLSTGLDHAALFERLPHARQEERLIEKLNERWLRSHHPYGPQLAAVLLPWLQQRPIQDYDWSHAQLLGEIATRLPPDTPVEEGWPPERHHAVEKLVSTMRFRRSMHQELQGS